MKVNNSDVLDGIDSRNTLSRALMRSARNSGHNFASSGATQSSTIRLAPAQVLYDDEDDESDQESYDNIDHNMTGLKPEKARWTDAEVYAKKPFIHLTLF